MLSGNEFVISILDYGAGNVRSLRNAIKHLGFQSRNIRSTQDIESAQAIIFPGQGCFHQAMQSLHSMGVVKSLQNYLRSNRPFFGICLGMQLLFESSDESPGVDGLGIIPGKVTRFDEKMGAKIPQICWNQLSRLKGSNVLDDIKLYDMVYFVHSYCALPTQDNLEWILTLTDYNEQRYISMVQKGNVIAAQFHPEKSGVVGLKMIPPATFLAKRVIACLDVRSNDKGDLVVTKGDQYDVREQTVVGRGEVRNLGKPVTLCQQYYEQGADEVVFLNITSFRQGVMEDMPMLQVLELSSENVFVPLTVGGGIRDYIDIDGVLHSALEVASQYFRAGADKVSIGSDAVYSAEEYLGSRIKTGNSSIEQISCHYGAQAVVVSIDPKRVYIAHPFPQSSEDILSKKTVVRLREGECGPNGETYCWWQVTVKGGRESRDMDAIQLAKICEILGAGEIMLNCIDMDGQGNGYDIPLIRAVEQAVSIPIIASSGAGAPQHFVDVFVQTNAQAALAAGIFHRGEVKIDEVKSAISNGGCMARV